MRPDGNAGPRPHEYEVAFICTGNRARSPFAAELLRRRVAGLPVSVSSYGTLELGPVPALPNALSTAQAVGVDLDAHRAQAVTEGALASTDLVVGFEPIHVATAVVTGGAAREHAFLLTELAGLLEAVAPADRDPEGLVALAHARRREDGDSPHAIADPLGRSRQTFAEIFAEIERNVEVVADALFPRVRPAAS